MRLSFPSVLVVGLMCSSCDLAEDAGYRDFTFRTDDELKEPGQYFCGWIQRARGEPVYAVCMMSETSNAGKWRLDIDDYGHITGFNGNRVEASRRKKAIYALQPDLSLSEIALSKDEVKKALAMLDNPDTGGVLLREHPVIHDKIIPQLKFVTISYRDDPNAPGFHIVKPDNTQPTPH